MKWHKNTLVYVLAQTPDSKDQLCNLIYLALNIYDTYDQSVLFLKSKQKQLKVKTSISFAKRIFCFPESQPSTC